MKSKKVDGRVDDGWGGCNIVKVRLFSKHLDNQRNSERGSLGKRTLRCAKLVLPLSRATSNVEVLLAGEWWKATVVAKEQDKVHYVVGSKSRAEDEWVAESSGRLRWPMGIASTIPMPVPRTRRTSKMDHFGVPTGNNNVVLPGTVSSGSSSVGTTTSAPKG